MLTQILTSFLPIWGMFDMSRIPAAPSVAPSSHHSVRGSRPQVRDAVRMQRRRHEPAWVLQHERADRRRDRPEAGERDGPTATLASGDVNAWKRTYNQWHDEARAR